MIKNYQIRNKEDLCNQLNLLKTGLRQQENAMLQDAKDYVGNVGAKLTGKITKRKPLLETPNTLRPLLKGNPMATVLPNFIKKTFFKRSGWLTRFIMGFAVKKAGKMLDKKVFQK